MYYLKYMPYKSIRAASRNKRELDAAAEAGYKTAVFSNDRQEEALAYFGGEIINDGTLPMLGSKVKRIITIVRNRLTVYKNTLALPNGVWSCHDLHSLKIAYFATRFRLKKPIFIYDSHEFEMGRNTRRNAFQRFLTKHEERFLMNRCAFSIMVNDSIADEVQRIHKLKKRPIVVRSTPDYWTIDEDVCKEQHRLFMEEFTKSGGVIYLLMYHGAVIRDRGIERLIEAVAQLEGVGLVILGNGNDDYVASLHSFIRNCKVEDRVVFHPAVPLAQLWKYVGAADLSMAPIELVAKNHYYSLPNKFFESIQSLTPIIASDVPEMRRIIDQYKIGLTCKPGDVDDICRCIRQMLNDREFYNSCKKNLRKAKEELCWEKEKSRLLNAYETYLQIYK